jgi:hypothetical protein
MATGDPRKPKCAFCKRWSGDAQLTNQGLNNGFVRFEISAKGRCMARGSHVHKGAVDGANCRDYEISPEANRFI